MDRKTWERVEVLFNEAEGLDGAGRSRLLDALGNGEQLVRRELESLLAHAEEGPTFLEPPMTGALPSGPGSTPAAALCGRKLGSCTLVRPIAEGGMGTVFEATQEPFGRRVAVKVLRGGLQTEEALRRFGHEAKILAHLRHPGIAQVFEAGSEADPVSGASIPYLAMELIPEARDLVSAVAAMNLDDHARLALFVEICEAVHHGHQKGVIHRDLKPANILVDREGRPKVIDFGIARATGSDEGILTREQGTSTIIGTLPYMAPEQFLGVAHDLDIRCDVYSLGVILYRLLTGVLPHDLAGKTIVGAARVVQEEIPVSPGVHRSALRGDVETIILCALEKDRERRYASAAFFADDIRRYLGHRPIEARPAGLLRQITLFGRRKRSAFLAIVGVLLAIIAGVAVSLIFAWRASTSRARAEALLDNGRDFSRWVLEDHVRSLRSVPGATAARRELADRILRYLEGLQPHAGGDRRVTQDIAMAWLALGRTYSGFGEDNLGKTDEAQAALDRAIGLFEGLLKDGSGSQETRMGLAAAQGSRAEILMQTGSFDPAIALLDTAAESLRRLVVEDGRPEGPRRNLVVIEQTLGDVEVERGDPEKALGHYGTALELALVNDGCGRTPASRRALFKAHWHVGKELLAAGKTAEARPRIIDALALTRGAVAEEGTEESRRDLAVMLIGEGDLVFDQDVALALTRYEEARVIRERFVTMDPASSMAKRGLAVALERIGDAETSLGNPAAAAVAYRREAELAESLVALDPKNRDAAVIATRARERAAQALRAAESR